MKAPYLEINLAKLQSNASKLVTMFGARGINITGITKCVLGDPQIADCMVAAGVSSIGDSRLENIIRMKTANVQALFVLIRAPSIHEAHDVIANVDISFNTELLVIAKLSKEALRQHTRHGIVLMVEMGDLREGILLQDLSNTINEILHMKGVRLLGLGTNLACMNGVKPSRYKMDELSYFVNMFEEKFDIELPMVSGGNSANFQWVQGNDKLGRINNIRLGESILIGRETLAQKHIQGLYLNVITLVAEVIESKIKPSFPEGETGKNAFGDTPSPEDKGNMLRSIVALGKQDTNVAGLTPLMDVDIVGSSSDHIVLDTSRIPLHVGDKVRFGMDYNALLSAMTSPFVGNVFTETATLQSIEPIAVRLGPNTSAKDSMELCSGISS